jgi:hypothetical protein
MNNANNPPGLNAVLYSLYHIKDVHDPATYDRLLVDLSSGYSLDVLKMYYNAVKWSLEHKSEDFSQRLPNLNRSNEDVLYFLEQAKPILKTIIDSKAINSKKPRPDIDSN